MTPDARDLLAAHLALFRAQMAAWLVPRGRLVSADGVRADDVVVSAADGDRAAALARGIERAAAMTPLRPKCLVRAVALRRLLERNGLTGSVLRVGVRRNGATIEAHAWVTFGGMVIGDTPARTAQFRELDGIHAVQPR